MGVYYLHRVDSNFLGTIFLALQDRFSCGSGEQTGENSTT